MEILEIRLLAAIEECVEGYERKGFRERKRRLRRGAFGASYITFSCTISLIFNKMEQKLIKSDVIFFIIFQNWTKY